MSSGRTRKACPGCGDGPYRYPWRQADEVCETCKERLQRVLALEARERQVDDDEVALAIPWAPHALAHVPHDRLEGEPFSRNEKGINLYFWKILHLVGPVSPIAAFDWKHKVFRSNDHISGSSDQGVVVKRELAELLQDLHERIIAVVDQAYKEGVEQGNRAIVRLAQGEISVQDYEQRFGRDKEER